VKALVYDKANALDHFALELRDVGEPAVRDQDLLIEVRAVGVNPGEAFIRSVQNPPPGGRVLLGWEFAGVVAAVGRKATGFEVGDRVFGTGDMTRDGAWAERVAVDYRIVARIPDGLSFVDAASLAIGSLTATEAIFREDDGLPTGTERVLIVGGAGAVGSMATQILKARTSAFVIATASRPDSRAWSQKMGADLVVDHSANVPEQLKEAGVESVDLVLSLASTTANMPWYAKVLRAFGHLSVVDGGQSLDVAPLAGKAASVHLEMVFSRILFGRQPERQGWILADIAALAASGEIRPIVTTHLHGLSVESMKSAHTQLESHRTVGKIVIEY
jgi:zinc-binding alcohol dehydrogenase family protein